ncbi:single-stranded-DNA-specific exonuclease RecJ [Thiosocius teredinicola]|uniref:single-stranded-DNA-specific exonuclease RecJ n=1 Tax=Thiosocius teredinicola TaxID=1973002 RepID=UPI000990DE2C
MRKQIVRYRSVEDTGPVPDGCDPLLWRIYRSRGVNQVGELERELSALIPPDALDGLDDAVSELLAAMEQGKRILIVGDFDADGATSSALAVLALRAFGHSQVSFLVPNRFEFGYGLTPEIVEHARRFEPDLIVTVDNGVSSVAGVATANALGWDVVVTDHHLAREELPAAKALVNPNLPGCGFASKALAGVGVIFYVMLGLRRRLRDIGWFERRRIAEPNMAEFLDLVALGTVADVVPLDQNNRVLVHQGLMRIRAGRCRPGITALLRVAGRNPQRAQAVDMGFAVGPRLNAAGRIDDMSLGIACLLADDEATAEPLAAELDRLNRERRQIEGEMKDQAEALLEAWSPHDPDALPWGLCLYQEDWHQGVIGILASRIKERYHRPVIAFAKAGDGVLKGSARSIPGLHIRDALDEVAVRNPRVLQKFGGHAMAAGMTIDEEAFDAFTRTFDAVVREHLAADDLQAVIHSDGGVDEAALNLETARAIIEGGPWGQGFPEPMFDDEFEVVSSRVVGEKHWKLVVSPMGSRQTIDAIAFNAVETLPQMPARVRAAYRLDENEWQGRVSLQLRFEYLEGVAV